MSSVAVTARAEIAALAARGLDLPTFGGAALDVLTRAVPFSAGCWAPVDPATRLITGGVTWGPIGDEHDEDYLFHEYEGPDPFTFETLLDRPGGVATAAAETGGDPGRSPRFVDLYRPHWGDIGDEARIALRADGSTWGFLALFRDGSRSRFTADEQEYLSTVRAALAAGLRAGVLASSATDLATVPHGPVVLVVDGSGDVVRSSVGAEQGLAELGAARALGVVRRGLTPRVASRGRGRPRRRPRGAGRRAARRCRAP